MAYKKKPKTKEEILLAYSELVEEAKNQLKGRFFENNREGFTIINLYGPNEFIAEYTVPETEPNIRALINMPKREAFRKHISINNFGTPVLRYTEPLLNGIGTYTFIDHDMLSSIETVYNSLGDEMIHVIWVSGRTHQNVSTYFFKDMTPRAVSNEFERVGIELYWLVYNGLEKDLLNYFIQNSIFHRTMIPDGSFEAIKKEVTKRRRRTNCF